MLLHLENLDEFALPVFFQYYKLSRHILLLYLHLISQILLNVNLLVLNQFHSLLFVMVCGYMNFKWNARPPFSYNSLYIISFRLYKSFCSFVISCLSNTTILSNNLDNSSLVNPFFLMSSIALNINSSLSSNLFNVLNFVSASCNFSFSFTI